MSGAPDTLRSSASPLQKPMQPLNRGGAAPPMASKRGATYWRTCSRRTSWLREAPPTRRLRRACPIALQALRPSPPIGHRLLARRFPSSSSLRASSSKENDADWLDLSLFAAREGNLPALQRALDAGCRITQKAAFSAVDRLTTFADRATTSRRSSTRGSPERERLQGFVDTFRYLDSNGLARDFGSTRMDRTGTELSSFS